MNQSLIPQDLRGHVAALHKRRGIVITCVGLALVAATLYNYTTRPLYQATTQILIDRDTPNVLPTREIVDARASYGDLQTQLELLRARSLAEKVIARAGLQRHPELSTGPLMSPWERFERRFLGRTSAAAVDKNGIPLSPAVVAFRSRVQVEPVKGSRLVNIRFNAYDPPIAAEAANTLAQVFIEEALEYRYTTSGEATVWLSDRVKEQQEKLKAAERALQAYRERERLVNVEERQGLVDQKLANLNQAAMEARRERIEKQALLDRLRSLGPGQVENYPLVAQSPVVQTVRAKLSELRAEEGRLAQTLGPKHPDLVRLRADIQDAEGRIRTEVQAIIRAVEADHRTSADTEASLNAGIEASKHEGLDLSRKAIEYGGLKREVEANQKLLRELMGRTQEGGLESELRSTNVRIVEKAEPPKGPFLPRRTRNYQMALLLGLALGIGLALLFEHLDNSFKTPDDVKAVLGVPFLGMVPDGTPRTAPGPRRGPTPMHRPSSVAEAYRVLRTNLLFSSAGAGSGRVLLVTSANPGEGKTTTTVNLAESLAHNGSRVIILDADLRKPNVHIRFAVAKTPGLSDLIVGKVQASQAIRVSTTKGLSVLTCGYIPPNPAELLGSTSMREVLQALREHFDWVLIDTPPALAMADTPVLCPIVDGVILVIGAENGSKPTVQRAVDQIQGVGGKITGAVLNKVDLDRNAYYYSQYYGEYYRSYYADRSGETRPVTIGRGRRPGRPA